MILDSCHSSFIICWCNYAVTEVRKHACTFTRPVLQRLGEHRQKQTPRRLVGHSPCVLLMTSSLTRRTPFADCEPDWAPEPVSKLVLAEWRYRQVEKLLADDLTSTMPTAGAVKQGGFVQGLRLWAGAGVASSVFTSKERVAWKWGVQSAWLPCSRGFLLC